MTQRAQIDEELDVFRRFAGTCPLGLVPETAVPLDPNQGAPDILCALDTGEKLVFELVSAEDTTTDKAIHKSPVPWTTKIKLRDELRKALTDAWDEALANGRLTHPKRFEFHDIDVRFENDARFEQRKQAMRRVIELLNERGPGRHPIKDGVIWSIRCEPYTFRSSQAGPRFSVDTSFCFLGVRIVERIAEKLKRGPYSIAHPVHLLAYSSSATAEECDGLAELLESEGTGQFARIWVFNYGSVSIAFDSGRWCLPERSCPA